MKHSVKSVDKLNFQKIIQKLRKHYGSPLPPYTTDPFEMVLWENVAYLVDDGKREKIFEELRSRVGLKPIDILNASITDLESVTKLSGAGSQQRAARLKESA